LFAFLTFWLTIHPVVIFQLPVVKLLELLAHYALLLPEVVVVAVWMGFWSLLTLLTWQLWCKRNISWLRM